MLSFRTTTENQKSLIFRFSAFLLSGIIGEKVLWVLLVIIVLNFILPNSDYSWSEILFFDDKFNIKSDKDEWIDYNEIKALDRGKE